MSSSGVPALLGWWYSNNYFTDKLNCLCASENQVVVSDDDDVEDFDDTISAYYHKRKQGRLYRENFMASYHFDGFEQGDESIHSIHRKDTMPMQNTSLMSYESEEQDEETRQEAPRVGNRGHKRVSSMDSHTTSSADTCTTVSLSQSFMYDDDEVCSAVTTEEVKNLQSPFRCKGRTDSNHEHEAYRYMQRMKSDNYIGEE
jgi:hypothetical protein